MKRNYLKASIILTLVLQMVKKLIPQSFKNIYHLGQAILANVWFGFPDQKLRVIGVTGTNGKTTTIQMVAKILEKAGYKVAVASTINFKIAEKEWVNKSKFTTLSSWKLQRFLKQAQEAGCEYAVLEVSSHSLDQNRVWGISFGAAVLTNITREHLDYHKTMEEYAKAKARLFAMLGKPGKTEKTVSVANLNSKYTKEFLEYPAKEKYGYGIEVQSSKFKIQNGNSKLKVVIAENIKLDINHSQFSILNTQFILNLPGIFNIENALAATCVGLSQGISLKKISEALAEIKGVPGRMERIENNRGLEIIVDYAVTPDSLEKLYRLISEIRDRRENREAKIIAVFGSCGERDRGKRPIMGKIVARYADYVIVTNEDPYREDPQKIIDEVFAGVVGYSVQDSAFPGNFSKVRPFSFSSRALEISQDQTLKNYSKPDFSEGVNVFRILDRREAIKKALRIARQGDIVVVTGKGAEETMAIGSKRIPWNDPKVIREVLKEI